MPSGKFGALVGLGTLTGTGFALADQPGAQEATSILPETVAAGTGAAAVGTKKGRQLIGTALKGAGKVLAPLAIPLEAGFMIWKVREESIKIVEEWLEYCTDIDVINNAPSTLAEELNTFKEHRNDQSILTNLAIRDGLSVGGQDYRNYIECDYDYWYERGSAGYGRDIDKFLVKIKNA